MKYNCSERAHTQSEINTFLALEEAFLSADPRTGIDRLFPPADAELDQRICEAHRAYVDYAKSHGFELSPGVYGIPVMTVPAEPFEN